MHFISNFLCIAVVDSPDIGEEYETATFYNDSCRHDMDLQSDLSGPFQIGFATLKIGEDLEEYHWCADTRSEGKEGRHTFTRIKESAATIHSLILSVESQLNNSNVHK